MSDLQQSNDDPWEGQPPSQTCIRCDGAAAVNLSEGPHCLEHLPPPALQLYLDRLYAHEATFDLRGVAISAERWATFAAVFRHLNGGQLQLESASLERATFLSGCDFEGAEFGPRANLRRTRFEERTRLRHARFGEASDLRGAHFGDGCDLSDAQFGNGVRLGDAQFGSFISLGGARFGEAISLEGASFGDAIVLTGTAFGAQANLDGTRFHGRVLAPRSVFGPDAILRNVQMASRVALHHAHFGKRSEVQIRCEDDLILSDATFAEEQLSITIHATGIVNLRRAAFGEETRAEIETTCLDLSEATFNGPAVLRISSAQIWASETRLGGKTTFANSGQPRGAQLRSVQGMDVSNLIIVGLDITRTRFAGTQDLNKMRFVDTQLEKHDDRQRLYEERCITETVDLDPYELAHLEDRTACRPEQVSELYRLLRKSREDAADSPGGNDLYVGEQLMRALALKQSAQTTSVRGSRLVLSAYDKLGGYGVRPIRPLVTLIAVLVIAWLAVLAGDMVVRAPDSATAQRPSAPVAPQRISSSKKQPSVQTPSRTQPLSPPAADATVGPSAVFVLRSAVLLPTSSNVTTTTGGDLLQALLRILGPILLGLAGVALRAQVKR